jgi:small subunit ribosomal protein S16
VQDARKPRDGTTIEEIGTYDPIAKDSQVTLNEERAKYWVGQGAQPTDMVRKLFSKKGLNK